MSTSSRSPDPSQGNGGSDYPARTARYSNKVIFAVIGVIGIVVGAGAAVVLGNTELLASKRQSVAAPSTTTALAMLPTTVTSGVATSVTSTTVDLNDADRTASFEVEVVGR